MITECDCCGVPSFVQDVRAMRDGSPVYITACGICRRKARLTGRFLHALLAMMDAHREVSS